MGYAVHVDSESDEDEYEVAREHPRSRTARDPHPRRELEFN
jgi:hypothetical protein